MIPMWYTSLEPQRMLSTTSETDSFDSSIFWSSVRMNIFGNTWFNVTVLIVLLAAVIVLLSGEYIIENRIRSYMNRTLTDRVKVDKVDLNFFPISVDLLDSRLNLEGTESITAGRIGITPVLGSFFNDTVHIESVVLENVTIDLRDTDRGLQLRHSFDDLYSTTGTGSSESTASIVIEQLILVDGHVRIFGDERSRSPRFELTPIHMVVSPLDFRNLNQPINLKAAMKPDVDRPPVKLEGMIFPRDSEASFQGTITLDQFQMARTGPYLPKGYEISSGSLTGELPVTVMSGTLRLDSPELQMDQLTARIDGNTSSDSATKTEQSSQENGTFDVETNGPIVVQSNNTTFQYSSGEKPIVFRSHRGKTIFETLKNPTKILDSRGEFSLGEPKGTLQFDVRKQLNESQNNKSELALKAKFPAASELNPVILRDAPFLIKKGSVKSAASGTFGPRNLNIQVALRFQNLAIEDKPEVQGKFLQIPTSVLINYLSKQDGTFQMTFSVTGSPSNPKFDFSEIRGRLTKKLGLDAAVLAALGLPAFIGEKVIEQATGVSVFDEVTERLGSVFESDRPKIDSPFKNNDTDSRNQSSPKQ